MIGRLHMGIANVALNNPPRRVSQLFEFLRAVAGIRLMNFRAGSPIPRKIPPYFFQVIGTHPNA